MYPIEVANSIFSTLLRPKEFLGWRFKYCRIDRALYRVVFALAFIPYVQVKPPMRHSCISWVYAGSPIILQCAAGKHPQLSHPPTLEGGWAGQPWLAPADPAFPPTHPERGTPRPSRNSDQEGYKQSHLYLRKLYGSAPSLPPACYKEDPLRPLNIL